MPWLTVEKAMHGVDVLSIRLTNEKFQDDKWTNPRKMEISDEDAKLSIELLSRLYKDWINGAGPPIVTNVKVVETAENRDRIARLNKTLVRVARESNQAGERQAARDAYKALNGKDFEG